MSYLRQKIRWDRGTFKHFGTYPMHLPFNSPREKHKDSPCARVACVWHCPFFNVDTDTCCTGGLNYPF